MATTKQRAHTSGSHFPPFSVPRSFIHSFSTCTIKCPVGQCCCAVLLAIAIINTVNGPYKKGCALAASVAEEAVLVQF